ncbi:MAG: sugar kinase [Gammaproteobacteria bacterium]|nr:sugar kinase [Gammaproteobacteria bacterium]
MKKVVLFGECMVELKQNQGAYQVPMAMSQGFAGDVFNAAVYLKRWFADIQVQLLTALGTDEMSQHMKDYFESEGLNNDLVLTSETKIPGLYSIQTDSSGERSFTYWRSDSAARYTLSLLEETAISQLKQADMFFFSGISLAIIQPEHRDQFWQLLWQLKDAGVEIVFDPNYRGRLWSSIEDTKSQYDLALQVSDKVLPGVEDFEAIYGHKNFEQVKAFCQPYNIKELVIKDGPNGVLVVHQEQEMFVDIAPVENLVDTTSAGDSFNGAYLGARLFGQGIESSVLLAAKTAGFVIQHPGAIVPKETFYNLLLEQHIQ